MGSMGSMNLPLQLSQVALLVRRIWWCLFLHFVHRTNEAKAK